MTAETSNVGIVGTHVERSLSPVMHNAAYREMGVALNYGVFGLPEIQDTSARQERLAGFLIEQYHADVVGMSVTMPFKVDLMTNPQVSAGSGTTRAIGSANTLSYPDNEIWYPDNTDWLGAVNALRESGVKIDESSAVVIGGGGTARAVAFGLAERGAKDVTLANRTESKITAMAGDLRRHYPKTDFFTIGLSAVNGKPSPATREAAEMVCSADIVYNTTSIGQEGTSESSSSPIGFDLINRLKKGTAVVDAVYMPLETVLLEAARMRGDLVVIDGTRMLLYQAVEQVKIFSGEQDIPVGVMDEALQAEVLSRLTRKV